MTAADDDYGAGPEQPGLTRQRRAVAAALRSFTDFRSAQDIHEAVHRHGDDVSLATVYRAVQWLVGTGTVDVIQSASGEALYRRCSESHHHHLVCRECGRTVEIHGPTVEEWADEVSARFGFADVNHTVELFGLCGPCRVGGDRDAWRRSSAR